MMLECPQPVGKTGLRESFPEGYRPAEAASRPDEKRVPGKAARQREGEAEARTALCATCAQG